MTRKACPDNVAHDAVREVAPKAEPKRLCCPRCGCEHLPVYRTRQCRKNIVRERRCRHCGQRVFTREAAV